VTHSHLLTWAIVSLAALGVIVRPFRSPEVVWAVAGATLLVVLGLLTPGEAADGIGKGTDVYLFLIGMMLLAEMARTSGLFDWLAAMATVHARGSAIRLFLLIYLVGTVVTTFLSNDATAVVLTPAVAAAVKTARAEQPLPYLLICAFVANAASFVLPISNPANLVIFGSHVPPLMQWLPRFTLPSVVSVVATYALLRFTQRRSLHQTIETGVSVPKLQADGLLAAIGIGAVAGVLMVASASDAQLGLPTAVAGTATTAVLLVRGKRAPWMTLRSISWGVLPLVAGLFVLVEGLDKTGVVGLVGRRFHESAERCPAGASWAAALVIASASNVTNNLPAGLIAARVAHTARLTDRAMSAILVGVDLGPNLSVTGSLATILWLTALRRDGHRIGAGAFLKIGLVVMPPALVLTLAAAFLVGR
jgi:arsenical pump membrane protein